MSELKTSPPHAWTQQVEHIVSRSLSFSEFEMSSHPIVILTAVSTTDFDVVACMQEINSYHHNPPCFATGQYEAEVHRVYLLVHDPYEAGPNVDPIVLLRKVGLPLIFVPFDYLYTYVLPFIFYLFTTYFYTYVYTCLFYLFIYENLFIFYSNLIHIPLITHNTVTIKIPTHTDKVISTELPPSTFSKSSTT
jgi:hypothetical protein